MKFFAGGRAPLTVLTRHDFSAPRRGIHAAINIDDSRGISRSHRDLAKANAKGVGRHSAAGRTRCERTTAGICDKGSELGALNKDDDSQA